MLTSFSDYNSSSIILEGLESIAPFYATDDSSLPFTLNVAIEVDAKTKYFVTFAKSNAQGLYIMNVGLLVNKNLRYWKFTNIKHIRTVLYTLPKVIESVVPFLKQMDGLAIRMNQAQKNYLPMLERFVKRSYLKTLFTPLPVKNNEKGDAKWGEQYLFLGRKGRNFLQIFKHATFAGYDLKTILKDGIPAEGLAEIKPQIQTKKSFDPAPSKTVMLGQVEAIVTNAVVDLKILKTPKDHVVDALTNKVVDPAPDIKTKSILLPTGYTVDDFSSMESNSDPKFAAGTKSNSDPKFAAGTKVVWNKYQSGTSVPISAPGFSIRAVVTNEPSNEEMAKMFPINKYVWAKWFDNKSSPIANDLVELDNETKTTNHKTYNLIISGSEYAQWSKSSAKAMKVPTKWNKKPFVPPNLLVTALMIHFRPLFEKFLQNGTDYGQPPLDALFNVDEAEEGDAAKQLLPIAKYLNNAIKLQATHLYLVRRKLTPAKGTKLREWATQYVDDLVANNDATTLYTMLKAAWNKLITEGGWKVKEVVPPPSTADVPPPSDDGKVLPLVVNGLPTDEALAKVLTLTDANINHNDHVIAARIFFSPLFSTLFDKGNASMNKTYWNRATLMTNFTSKASYMNYNNISASSFTKLKDWAFNIFHKELPDEKAWLVFNDAFEEWKNINDKEVKTPKVHSSGIGKLIKHEKLLNFDAAAELQDEMAKKSYNMAMTSPKFNVHNNYNEIHHDLMNTQGFSDEYNKLPQWMKDPIIKYCGSGYQFMNPWLRQVGKLIADGQDEAIINTIHKHAPTFRMIVKMAAAFKQFKPLPHDIVLYRGGHIDNGYDWDLTQPVIDPGFLSTSIDSGLNWSHNNTRFCIIVPKGSKVLVMLANSPHYSEQEIIMPPFSVLKPYDKKIFDDYTDTQYLTCLYTGTIMDDIIFNRLRKLAGKMWPNEVTYAGISEGPNVLEMLYKEYLMEADKEEDSRAPPVKTTVDPTNDGAKSDKFNTNADAETMQKVARMIEKHKITIKKK